MSHAEIVGRNNCFFLSIHPREQKKHDRCPVCCAFEKRLNGAAAFFLCFSIASSQESQDSTFVHSGTKEPSPPPPPHRPGASLTLFRTNRPNSLQKHLPYVLSIGAPHSKPPHCPPWRFPSSGHCFSPPVFFPCGGYALLACRRFQT